MSGANTQTTVSMPMLVAANTVTSLSSTALLPLLDGSTVECITPANFITALGSRAIDAGIPLATGLAASDRLFLDQGGSSAVAMTLGTLLAYLQANLAAPGGVPAAPAASVTQVQFATGVSGNGVRTAFPVTLPSAPKPGNTLLLMLTSAASGDHGVTAIAAPAIPGYTLLPGALLKGYTQDVAGYTRTVQAGDGATLTIPANATFDCSAALVELSGVVSVETFGTQAPGGVFALAAKTNATRNVLRYLFCSTGAGPLATMSSTTAGINLLALNAQTYFSDGIFSVTGSSSGTVALTYTPNQGVIGYFDVLQVNVYGA